MSSSTPSSPPPHAAAGPGSTRAATSSRHGDADDVACPALRDPDLEPRLPAEVVAAILAHLPQASLAPCLRVNTGWYRLALPLLYRHIAIPPIAAGTSPHDVRDAHAPRPHGALRGPDPATFGSVLERLPARLRDLDPRHLVRELTVPPHCPPPVISSPGVVGLASGDAEDRSGRSTTAGVCAALSGVHLSLRTLHILLAGNNQSEIHTPAIVTYAPANRTIVAPPFLDLLQRGQATGGGSSGTRTCALLCSLMPGTPSPGYSSPRASIETIVIHRAGLLYSRLRPTLLPPALRPTRRVVILFRPDRATAGSAAKYEFAWAGGRGVLTFLDAFDPAARVPAVLVFDVDMPGDKWRPIPRPKDGADPETGAPQWLLRLLRAITIGGGSEAPRSRALTVVNIEATLDDQLDHSAVVAVLEEMVERIATEHNTHPAPNFISLQEWRNGQGRDVGNAW